MPQDLILDFSDQTQIDSYLVDINLKDEPLRHENFHFTVHHAQEMSVHIRGASPGKIISDYRPNEPNAIHQYRLDIYEPITKSESDKIMNVLARIGNPKNFSIKFNEKPSNLIPDDETLEVFLTEKFPFFGQLHTWIFQIVMEQDIADPNSIIAWKPKDLMEQDKFIIPKPTIFQSRQIIDYNLEHYYTFLLRETNEFISGNQKRQGKIYNFYTTTQIIEARQTGEKSGKEIYEISVILDHNLDMIPVVWMRGDFVDSSFPFLYESYISGILPHWNKAIRIDSDLDAQYVQHAYLERVEIQNECDNPNCSVNPETGVFCEEAAKGVFHRCQRCDGTGFVTAKSPHGVTVVKENLLEEKPIVFPGVEYIDKPIEIVRLGEDKVSKLITKGFSSINMEFLADIPLNQSGKAKEIDRTELESFVQKVSDNIFRIKEDSIKIINLYRHKEMLNEDQLKASLPELNKPTEFSVLTASIIAQELATLKNANASQDIIDNLEMELIDKKFSSEPRKKKISLNVIKLDPLRGVKDKFEVTSAVNSTQAREDFVISSYIKSFILRALEDDEEFLDKSRGDKIEILRQFAREKLEDGIITQGEGQAAAGA